MMEKIISYKGFKQDMTCRDFQYKEGESYEEPSAKACEREFYAYEYPLDCLDYYSPNESVYHVVEQSGEIRRSLRQKLKSAPKSILQGLSRLQLNTR